MKQSCRKTLQRLLFLITIVFANVVDAQTLPVQVTPQLIPPHSVKISDYATISNEKLFVNILLTDVNEIGRRVRLKMYIEGQGLNIATLENVVGANPIFLDGGVNLRLSNLDLQPYFQFNNLTGITSQQYNNPLPNGGYNYCFEVYDYFTGRRISEKSCTTVFLLQNDPPILNLPSRDNIVTATNPQNILFTWTPRHTNLNDVQYEFTLKELWDTQNPQAIFLGSVPFYQTTTRSTTLLVGPEAPQLISGKVYGWQVRAFVSDGINETSVFKNNGGSEIFWFKYLEDCRPPSFILSQALTAESVKIEWQLSDHIKYNIQYRKKGFGDDDWFDVSSYTNEGNIFNLEPDTVYEFRVGGECTPLSGFAYSSIQEFTTPTNDESAYYNCGITPEIKIENQELLPSLGINETFTAGDFPVTTREVTGSNGTFSGWGYITLPFLENLKEIIDAANILTSGEVNIGKYTRIKVEFESVKINTSKQLIEGVVKTTYDPDWGGIIDADEIINDIAGDNGNISTYDATDMDIDEVIVNEEGDIVIVRDTTDDGPEEEFLDDEIVIVTNLPVVITDENGDQWTVDEEGNVTQGTSAEGGQATSDNTNGVSGSGNVNEITSKDVVVKFVPSGYYGTDEYNSKISSDSYKDKYEFIKTYDDKEYSVLYKLVSDKPESTDIIKAEVTFANGKTKDDIVFKTKQGGKVDTEWSGNTATLTLKKQFDFGKDEIIATVKPKDSTQKYEVAGKLNTWHVKQREINLTLVSVNNAPLDGIKEGINNIYQKAGVKFNISVTSLSIGLDKMDVGDSDMISHYTNDEKAVIQQFKDKNGTEKERYYMFFFNDIQLTKNLKGFMPLKRQFGFVFKKDDASRTAAHELGHGIFGLKHPWDQYNDESSKGKTDYLMDYGSGIEFSHMDWQKLHAPGIQLYWFQDDEAGQLESYEYYASKVVVPGVFVSNLENYNKNTVSFVSSAGKLITLPSTVMDVTFHKKGDGTLLAFTLNEGGKKERYVSAVRYKGGEKESFAGYLKNFNVVAKTDWDDYVYKDKYSVKSSFPKNNVEVFLGKLNNKPCGINLFTTKIANTTSGNWNSGGNKEPLNTKDYIAGSTKITTDLINSSPACDFCKKGKEFFELHADVNNERILSTLKDISDLICDPEADPSFFEEFSKEGYKNLLAWQKRYYDEGIWENDEQAYNAFYNAYFRYIELYKANKSVFNNLKWYDREQILKSTYQLSWNQLKMLTAKQRAGMLQVILNGHVGGYWTSTTYNTEAIVLNILKSVNDDKEVNQIKDFLGYLVDENYKVGGDLLYKQLVDKVNDSFFGTDQNRLVLINQLTQLALKAKGIDISSERTLTTNQEYQSLLADAQCKGDFYWEVTNERFLWLFNRVNDKSNLEFDFIDNQKKVRLRQFCTKIETNNYGEYSSATCTDWKIKGEFDPFELVALNIINDLTFTKQSGACNNDGAVVCGQVMLVPAMFIDYLDRKRSNTQIQNGIFNTLTVASFYFSGSTIIAARGAISLATIPAYADLFVTIANPYFADDKLFVAHATSVIKTTFFDYDPNDKEAEKKAEDKAKEIAKILQMSWNFATIPLTLDTASSVVNPKKHIEAVATWRALIRKFGSRSKAKKAIADKPELAEKMAKGMDAVEDNIRASSSSSKLLDDEIAKKSKEIDDILGDAANVVQNLQKSILDKLPDGSKLKKTIENLDPSTNESLIGKIFDLKDARLNAFNKIVTKVLNPQELDDVYTAYMILVQRSPKIAEISENSFILAKVHKRFKYGGLDEFDGLNKLFNEGSQVSSKQKLIDQLKKADEYFESAIPVEFSAIKKGDVKITVIDRKGKGAEIGRYQDGILQKKKVITEADGGTVVKKADDPDDDVLRKGDEVGFRKATEKPASYTEEEALLLWGNSKSSFKKAKKSLEKSGLLADFKSNYPELTELEIISIYRYTASSKNLNNPLNKVPGYVLDEKLKIHKKVLDVALDKLKKTKAYKRQVYRGSNLDESLVLSKYKSKEGKVITEDAFTSSSRLESVADDFIRKFEDPAKSQVKYIINSKNGADVNKLSHFTRVLGDDQAEILFKSGTKFKVHSVEKNSKGIYEIKMTEL
ncbi:NAD(+)--protein-arginine ADP-ribosyltransferase [Tenacibaculum sp. 190524A05c]